MKKFILFIIFILTSCSLKLVCTADVHLLNSDNSVNFIWDNALVTLNSEDYIYFIDKCGISHYISGNIVIQNCKDSVYIK